MLALRKNVVWLERDNDRDVYFQFSASSTHMYYLYQMQIGDHKQDVSRPTPFDLYFYPHKGSFDYTIGALHPNIRYTSNRRNFLRMD